MAGNWTPFPTYVRPIPPGRWFLTLDKLLFAAGKSLIMFLWDNFLVLWANFLLLRDCFFFPWGYHLFYLRDYCQTISRLYWKMSTFLKTTYSRQISCSVVTTLFSVDITSCPLDISLSYPWRPFSVPEKPFTKDFLLSLSTISGW